MPPVQRVGARGAAPPQRGQQRGQQRGGPPGRGGRAITHSRGGGAPARTIHTAADKNLYVHLLGHLRKKALLPTVVFTLSKKRCEENAATLTNADLCTSVEKSEVHVAIEKALSRLKGSNLFVLCSHVLNISVNQVQTRNFPRSPEHGTFFCAELAFIMEDFYLS